MGLRDQVFSDLFLASWLAMQGPNSTPGIWEAMWRKDKVSEPKFNTKGKTAERGHFLS